MGILTGKLRKNKTVPFEDNGNDDENKNVIPRKIWMMWDQGLDNAPLSVKQCHESWVRKNPDHTVQMLTLKEGEELVGKGCLKIVIFYTEILTIKVVLWSFFMNETSEKSHNSTFQVKISV